MNAHVQQAIQEHRAALDAFQAGGAPTVEAAADLVIDVLRAGGGVYLCGNGGSAADAQHIAGELVGRFRRERRALRAVALTADTSVLTALGNDYDYRYVFARQVEALVGPTDLLWAFSTSGASANVLAAAEEARRRQAKILAFTGRADSPLERLADVCLCVDAPATSTAQEIHQLAYHIVCDLVEQAFAGDA